MKGEIGFSHGVPENPETKWEKKLDDDTTAIFTKTRAGDGFFIYNCEWRRENEATATSRQTPSDMPPDEVERIPRFLDFITGKI